MSDKQNYLSAAEERLHQWKTEVQKFRVIAEVADKDAQIAHYHVIEQLSDLEKNGMELLDNLKQANDEAQLEQLRRDFDAVGERLEKAIEDARAVIN